MTYIYSKCKYTYNKKKLNFIYAQYIPEEFPIFKNSTAVCHYLPKSESWELSISPPVSILQFIQFVIKPYWVHFLNVSEL